MNWLKKQEIAHRGLHNGFSIPENSIISFKKAIEYNYAIELDVRITKDKKIVVFHDKNLKRLCGINKKINSLKYKELSKFNLYNTDEKIPLLEEVLDLISGQVPVLIEIKNYGKVGIFEESICKVLDEYKGKFVICSFNPDVVFWFKKNRVSFKRGLIFGDLKKFQIKFYKTTLFYRILKCKPQFISLDFKLLRTSLPSLIKIFKLPLVCWTINSKRKKKKALRIVDNIIFENLK